MSDKDEFFLTVLRDLPLDPAFVRGLFDGIGRLVGPGPGYIALHRCYVSIGMPEYVEVRDQLNAITRDWFQRNYAEYRPGFDPYVPPSTFDAEPEYRFPVAQYVRDSADIDKNLVIQVDAVHTPKGSFLEFLTQFGEKRLKKYADLVGVELEIWDGRLADRWGD